MSTPAAEVMNDLILMNNDRIKGYQKTIKNLKEKDKDLQDVFSEIIEQTTEFNRQLSEQVTQMGAEAETHTSASGKMHLAWISLRATFTGHNRRALLAECERGEDALRQGYFEALNEDNDLSSYQWELISEQAAAMKLTHDRIKALRDQAG